MTLAAFLAPGLGFEIHQRVLSVRYVKFYQPVVNPVLPSQRLRSVSVWQGLVAFCVSLCFG